MIGRTRTVGNSTNTSSQLMKLETLLCAKLFWRMAVPAKKFSRNTRSFKTHAAFHLEKKFKCHLCDRHFSTETNRKVHISRYHKSQDDETRYQCEHCGKTFDIESQLNNHRNLHRLQHHKMLQAQKKEEAGEEGQRRGW